MVQTCLLGKSLLAQIMFPEQVQLYEGSVAKTACHSSYTQQQLVQQSSTTIYGSSELPYMVMP